MEADGSTPDWHGGQRRRLNEGAWREPFKHLDGIGLTVAGLRRREGLSVNGAGDAHRAGNAAG